MRVIFPIVNSPDVCASEKIPTGKVFTFQEIAICPLYFILLHFIFIIFQLFRSEFCKLSRQQRNFTYKSQQALPNEPKNRSWIQIQILIPQRFHEIISIFFRFCQFLKLGSSDKILATVNVGNPVSRNAQKAIFRQWIEEDNQPKLKWNFDFD